MSRLFDGTDDVMSYALAASGSVADYTHGTLLIVARFVASGSWASLIELERSTLGVAGGISRNGTSGGLFTYNQSSGLGSTDTGSGTSFTISTADNWCLYAATKATGSASPTLYKIPIATGTRTTRQPSGTLANSSSLANGFIRIGGNDDFANIRVAAVAIFNGTVLTGAQLDGIASAKTTASIAALSPTWLIDDSDAFATDLIGSTDRTAIVGTADDADDPSGWVYGLGGGTVDLTVTPAAANTAWAGTTPARKSDASSTPAVANVAWAGSTPAIKVDKSLAPAAATVAWAGSTPAIDATGSLTLSPGVANVAWAGSTPAIVFEGDVTFSPAAAAVAWTGSTPVLRAVPDVAPEVPSEGGGAYESLEDISTEEPRSLTLHPGAAVVAWEGSTPTLRIVEHKPFRIRLPGRREKAPEPVELPRLDLTPRPATIAYAGSRATVRTASAASPGELAQALTRIEKLEARIAELEQTREEETLILAALSGS